MLWNHLHLLLLGIAHICSSKTRLLCGWISKKYAVFVIVVYRVLSRTPLKSRRESVLWASIPLWQIWYHQSRPILLTLYCDHDGSMLAVSQAGFFPLEMAEVGWKLLSRGFSTIQGVWLLVWCQMLKGGLVIVVGGLLGLFSKMREKAGFQRSSYILMLRGVRWRGILILTFAVRWRRDPYFSHSAAFNEGIELLHWINGCGRGGSSLAHAYDKTFDWSVFTIRSEIFLKNFVI